MQAIPKYKNKIIIILGPTASGKTSLAVKLAKQFSGEIISADSRQVYIGMDLGTGKEGKLTQINLPDLGPQSARMVDDIPQYLIDIISPKEIYSVANFQKSAESLIKNIHSRSKTPFIVGGTNFYIQALTEGYDLPVADKKELKIRAQLEKLPKEELLDKLKTTDPEYFKNADLHNTRRLIRALSVTLTAGQKISQLQKKSCWDYDTLYLAIDLDRQTLYQNIDKRVDDRIALGMIEEVQNLISLGIPKERLVSFGLEYRFITEYLTGEIPNKHEMIQKLKYSTHAYARRQLIWLRNKMPVVWIKNYHEAVEQIDRFLAK